MRAVKWAGGCVCHACVRVFPLRYYEYPMDERDVVEFTSLRRRERGERGGWTDEQGDSVYQNASDKVLER